MIRSKYKVILIQLPEPQFSLQKKWGNVPLAAGYLKAMAMHNGLNDDIDIEILNAEDTNLSGDARLVNLIVAKSPNIVGWSTYVWNAKRVLHLSACIKKQLPKVKILVGGPEVTPETDYIANHPAIDIGCYGEGEITFTEILKAILLYEADLSSIKGIFYRKSKELIVNPQREYLKDLNQIPSPFLSDFFNIKKLSTISYETLRGCPNHCSYCQTAMVPLRFFSSQRVLADIEKLIWHRVEHIRLVESNFIIHPEFSEITDGIAKLNNKFQTRFSAFTYAEHLNNEKVHKLKKANFHCIEIGLQTIHNNTLKKLHRPALNKTKFIKGIRLLEKYDIAYGIDTIVGLPGETFEDHEKTIDWIKENKFEEYYSFPLMIMRGTKLKDTAEAFGFSYQKKPPYYVQHTPDICEEEIEEAIQRSKFKLYDSSLNLVSGEAKFSNVIDVTILGGKQRVFRQNELLNYSRINKIIMDIDILKKESVNTSAVYKEIKTKVCRPFTVWVKIGNKPHDFSIAKQLILDLIRENPFLLLKVIVEFKTDYSSEFFEWLDKNVRSSEIIPKFIKEKNTVKKYQVLPFNIFSTRAMEINSNIKNVWAYSIRRDSNFQKDLDVIASRGLENDNILFRLEDVNIDMLMDIFKRLHQMKLKSCWFENIILHYCWKMFKSMAMNSDACILDHLPIEPTVTMNDKVGLIPMILPDHQTYMDIVACQLKFLKLMQNFPD